MTQKERLVELIDKMIDEGEEKEAFVFDIGYEIDLDFMADYLLANGVIVPPCKVGDEIYYSDRTRNKICRDVVRGVGLVIEVNGEYWFVSASQFGDIFKTREEAENGLKFPQKGDTVFYIGVDLGKSNPNMNLKETVLEETYNSPLLTTLYRTYEEAEQALKERDGK